MNGFFDWESEKYETVIYGTTVRWTNRVNPFLVKWMQTQDPSIKFITVSTCRPMNVNSNRIVKIYIHTWISIDGNWTIWTFFGLCNIYIFDTLGPHQLDDAFLQMISFKRVSTNAWSNKTLLCYFLVFCFFFIQIIMKTS